MESLGLFSQVENDLPVTTGDKDLGCKWNFVQKPKGTMKRDREDSSFDPFKDNEVRCLVREYIQNSIDAAQKSDDNGNKKVLVTFSYGKMAWKIQSELTPRANVSLTPENFLFLTP